MKDIEGSEKEILKFKKEHLKHINKSMEIISYNKKHQSTHLCLKSPFIGCILGYHGLLLFINEN